MKKNFGVDFKKILTIIILTAALCCFAAGCEDGETATVTDIALRARGLSDGVLNITEGAETIITATLTPSDSAEEVTFSTADASVASVSASGAVRGVAAGETTLTAAAGGYSETIIVRVAKYVSVERIAFSSSEVEIATGVRKQLEYEVFPADATNKALSFTVSPAGGGVTVTSEGIVEVENGIEGGTEFTVTAVAANETGVSASVTIVIMTYALEDILLVGNDFHTEISEITVPLDEPYRVLFQQAVPEKAIAPGEMIPTEWRSDDESVCTVNGKGRLTFLSEGTATITMSAMGIEKSVRVTVTEPCGDFKDGYYLPQSYIDAIDAVPAPSADGWNVFADFRDGGTGAADARRFVLCNYKYFTGPSSWFAGGGYCIEMGGWDNIHSGLEDDDLPGEGQPNLYMWTKLTLGGEATSVRAHFEYRQSDATFKYKLRFSAMDIEDDYKKYRLSDWQTDSFNTDPNLSAGETFIEADIPAELKGKTVLLILEYDDIDYTVDGILNGVESVNIKYFSLLNYDGTPIENAFWLLGDDIMSEDYTGTLAQDIAAGAGLTLFRDTVNDSKVTGGAKSGIVERIDSGYYRDKLARYGAPEVIAVQRGTHDVYAYSMGEIELGAVADTDKTTVCGAIRYALEYFTENYPGARIIWSTPIYRYNAEAESVAEYNAALRTICAEYGAEVLDLYGESGIDEASSLRYLSDGVHLTAEGQLAVSELWVAALKEE